MKAELLKHSNFVILSILGEILVKLCFTGLYFLKQRWLVLVY